MTTLPPDRNFFRPKEVARYLEEPIRNIRYWISTGRIKTVKHGRKHKITREELERLLSGK
jgi:excisionase family DNA binding protein